MIVAPLTDAQTREVLDWRYEPPYDVYDPGSDPRQRERLRGIRRDHPDGLCGVVGDDGALVGYFIFVPVGGEVRVGLALRPDLTGRGLGAAFVQAGLAYARARWSPRRFRLWVRGFDERARRVYARSGFSEVGRSRRGELEIVEMELSA